MTLTEMIQKLRSMQPKRDPKFAGVRADVLISVAENGDVTIRCRGRDRGLPWIDRDWSTTITNEHFDEDKDVEARLVDTIDRTVKDVTERIRKAEAETAMVAGMAAKVSADMDAILVEKLDGAGPRK